MKLSDVEPPDILSDLSETEVYCLSDSSVLVYFLTNLGSALDNSLSENCLTVFIIYNDINRRIDHPAIKMDYMQASF